MAWRIERTLAADLDLTLLFEHLVRSALETGEDEPGAIRKAASRLRRVGKGMRSLAAAPYRGASHPELGENIRHVTKDRAIYYFQIDEETETLRVLAVFFGGQDHGEHIRRRLLWDDPR